MKRDKHLIRKILKWARGFENLKGSSRLPEFVDYNEDEVTYHVIMCIEAGFLRGEGDRNRGYHVFHLTWAGHEYLESKHP